jgi:RNA polymerase sigma factor (sigma-70 family)
MADRALRAFTRRIRAAVSDIPSAVRTDGELLARFARARDESAFAELVDRHGRLVQNVCRNVLADERDVEEATQATFLLLARRAASLRRPEALAGWLHGVAYRTALRARRDAARRRERESRLRAAPAAPPGPVAEASWRELQAILDEELQRLPERLRAPLALCCLEGYGYAAAARLLGCKTGTLSSRMDEARKLLGRRLARRGVSLSAVLCGLTVVAGATRAGLPAAAASGIVAAAGRYLREGPAAVPAGSLAAALLRGRWWTPAMAAAILAAVLGVLATGVGVSLRVPGASAGDGPQSATPPLAAEATGPRRDRLGDPLPDGAIARLGNTRFSHSWYAAAAVWSADGKFLACTGGYSTARPLCVFDAVTGRELHELPCKHLATAAAFSPDGKTLAVAEGRGVILWDAASGKEIAPLIPCPDGFGGGVAVAFSPDGKTVAGANHLGGIQLREVTTGRLVGELKPCNLSRGGLAYAPDGKCVASAAEDGTVVLWDLATRKERWRTALVAFRPDTRGPGVAFSPDGKALASTGADGVTRIWDAASGKILLSFGDGNSGGPNGPGVATWSPDGRVLVTPGPGEFVCFWDASTGKELRRWRTKEQWVNSVSFAPDGRTLATTARWGCRVRLWDLATGEELRPAPGHNSSVRDLAFSPDGKTLWSVGIDRLVIRWDVASAGGKVLSDIPRGTFFQPTAFGRDGKLLAVGGSDGCIQLYDGDGHAAGTLKGHAGVVQGVAFSPDGKVLASTANDRTLRFWDVAARKALRPPEPTAGRWTRLAFSPDGRKLALARTGTRVVDVPGGKELYQLGAAESTENVAFSPDGKTLVTTGGFQEAGVRLWDAATGKSVGRSGGDKDVHDALAYSPDGWLLAVGKEGSGDTISLREVATGQEVDRLRGHHTGVSALAFSPDGRRLASGGKDATILIWDLTGPAAGTRGREPLSSSRLDECWKDLDGEDAPAAYRAVRALAADPARSVPFLAARLRPSRPADPARLARLVAELDADGFDVRERAESELVRLGDAARPALRKLCEGPASAEARRRAEAVLEKLASSPEWPRQRRAVAALEHAGTPEARHHLEALAAARAETRLTEEARAALARRGGAH